MTDVKFLAHEELVQYNERLNARNKKRLKYHGEIDISVSPFSFDVIATDRDVKVGDVYQIVNTTDPDVDSITVDDVEYSVGDWVISMSEVDKAGTGVTVKKLGSSSSKHPFLIASDKLPDESKFKEDHVVLLIEDEIDNTDPGNPVIVHRKGLWRYDYLHNNWTLLNESSMVDIDYIFDNTLTESYAGSEVKLVDSKYLDGTLKNLSRYINPLLNPNIVILEDKAAREALDLTTLEDGKEYIYIVKEDESSVKDIDTGFISAVINTVDLMSFGTIGSSADSFQGTIDSKVYKPSGTPDVYEYWCTAGELVADASINTFSNIIMEVFNRMSGKYQNVCIFSASDSNVLEMILNENGRYGVKCNEGTAKVRYANTSPIMIGKTITGVYVCDAVEAKDGKPVRSLKYVGDIRELIDHPIEFVTELPAAGSLDYPSDWRLYMYTPTAADEVRGLYYYDPDEDDFFPVNVYEDTDIDIDFMFDSTLTETYAGKKEHIVDSEYLDTTLKDLSRYINPLLNPKVVVLEDKAARDALDLTALEDGTEYIYIVKEEESDTKDIDTGLIAVNYRLEVADIAAGTMDAFYKWDGDIKVYVQSNQTDKYKYESTISEIVADPDKNAFSDVLIITDTRTTTGTNQNREVAAKNGTDALSFHVCDDGQYSMTTTGSRASVYDAFTKPYMVGKICTNVYVCDAVEGKDGKPVRALKLVGDIKELIGKEFVIVDDLPDLDDASAIPTMDIAYWLKEDVLDAGGAVDKHAGLYVFDSVAGEFIHPYEDTPLDFSPSFDGTKYLPDTDPNYREPEFSGDEDNFVSSKYLYDTFEDFARWVKPLLNPTIQILEDKTALDAIDVTTLDADKSYIYIVKNDEVGSPVGSGNIKITGTSPLYTIVPGDSTKLSYPSTGTDKIYYKIANNVYTDYTTFAAAESAGSTFKDIIVGCHSATSGFANTIRCVANTDASIKICVDNATSDYYVEAVDGNVVVTLVIVEDVNVKKYGTNVYVCNAIEQDASGDPERKIELVGNIRPIVGDQYNVVDRLPDYMNASAIPDTDTAFLLTKNQTVDGDDDGIVTYTPGEYLYDSATGVYKYLDEMHMLFKGELELDEDNREDWNDLIPCHIGDTYKLVSTKDVASVVIDDIVYKVGDFIIVSNDVMSSGDVTVEKITASVSGGIEIVNKLPIAGDADTLYALQKTREYDYTDVKWYILNDPTTHTIKSDGIYELATDTVVVEIKNVTSAADIDALCNETTALDASIQGQHICNYTKTYADGDTEVFWCTQTGTPFEPGATEWDEHVDSESNLQIYMYNTFSSTWHRIYPSEAGAVIYVDSLADVSEPSANMIYAVDGMSHIKYHRFSDTQIANGSIIHDNSVEINNVSSVNILLYSTIAEKADSVDTVYGFVPVLEKHADENTFVTYTKNGLPFACSYEKFVKGNPLRLYIYNGRDFEIIYPADMPEGTVSQIEVTSSDYELISTGAHPTITYSENTIYKITDNAYKDAPIAMLNGMNIASLDSIIDITSYPEDGDAELDDINRNSIYRTEEEKDRYRERKYYDVDGVVSEIVDNGVKEIATGDVIIWESLADESLLPGRITSLNLSEQTEDNITASTIAFYKDALSDEPTHWKCGKALGVTISEKMKEYQLGFYSDFNKSWEMIYPTEQEIEIETENIDFNDPDVWSPLKP